MTITKNMEITCINCPVGCRLKAVLEDGKVVSVSGNNCRRGDIYARQECVAPQRMVTAVVPVINGVCPVSVKTQSPIPKEDIQNCMRELSHVKISAPVQAGDIIIPDVCRTGVSVIATKSVEAKA